MSTRAIRGPDFLLRQVDAALDRRPWLVPVILVLLPCLSHLPPVLLHLHVDPIWYFGFIDTGAKHGGLPGRMYLDPYLGWTTSVVSRQAALDWLHGVVPWWNPYTGIGVPLAGQMQPSAFLLPFILLMALPAGLVWLTMSMQMLSGMATFALLRRLGITRLASLAGAAVFGLNGTLALMPGSAAVGCTLAFLPVLLWGIECARDPVGGTRAMWGLAIGIGGSLVAGFPETAYLDGLMGLAWAALRLAQEASRARFAWRVAAGGAIGLLIAAPVLIAFADELAGALIVTNHVFASGVIAPAVRPLLVLPSLYGATNSFSTVAWGGIGGYGGIALTCSALIGLARGAERLLKWLLCLLLLLALARCFGVQPFSYLINLVPEMRQVAFARYAAGGMEMALVVLAAFGVDAARTVSSVIAVRAVAVCALLLAVATAAAFAAVTRLPHGSFFRLLPTMMALNLCGALLAIVLVASSAWGRSVVLAGLMMAEALFAFGISRSAGSKGGTLDMESVRFLQANAGLSRVLSTWPFAPNFPGLFGIASLGHNMSPVPQNWLDHVDKVLLPGLLNVEMGATFWSMLPPPLDLTGQLNAIRANPAAYDAVDLGFLLMAPGSSWQVTNSPEPSSQQQPRNLNFGQSVGITLPPLRSSLLATAVGVQVATFGGTARGTLHARLCAGADCVDGTVAVDMLRDNLLGFVPLSRPLMIPAATKPVLTITRQAGDGDFAIWEYTPTYRRGLALTDDGHAVQAALSQDPPPGWRLVHSGAAVDIWQRQKPLDYFDAPGCTLATLSRTAVRVRCSAASTLTRRELYTPGWTAAVNGTPAEVGQIDGILESITLPSGDSTIYFSFAPPYANIGWLCATLGILSLAIASVRGRLSP